MTQERKPLKPCPFCGDTPRIENEADEVMGEIICAGCDITMTASAVLPDLRTAWNRRAGEGELVDALEGLLNEVHDVFGPLDDNPNDALDGVPSLKSAQATLAKARGDQS